MKQIPILLVASAIFAGAFQANSLNKKELEESLATCQSEYQDLEAEFDSLKQENDSLRQEKDSILSNLSASNLTVNTLRMLYSTSSEVFSDSAVTELALDPVGTLPCMINHLNAIKTGSKLIKQLTDIQNLISTLKSSRIADNRAIANAIAPAINTFYNEWSDFVTDEKKNSTLSTEQKHFIESELGDQYNEIINKYFNQ